MQLLSSGVGAVGARGQPRQQRLLAAAAHEAAVGGGASGGSGICRHSWGSRSWGRWGEVFAQLSGVQHRRKVADAHAGCM